MSNAKQKQQPQEAVENVEVGAIERRLDFVALVSVTNGNPNGDPDADNQPRQDSITNRGLMTDVAVKRRIRNYLQDYVDKYGTEQQQQTCDIYYQGGTVLEDANKKAQRQLKDKEKVRDALCRLYWDVRTFGAVAATKEADGGCITGPIQIGTSWSVDPIEIMPITITRMCKTSAKEGSEGSEASNRTMGKKYVVPFALYRIEGCVSPWYAHKTGFTEDDLTLFFLGLVGCWDHCVSTSSGQRHLHELHVFQHANYLGSAPRHELFQRVKVQRKPGVDLVRSIDDYESSVDLDQLPGGVRYQRGFLAKVWKMLADQGVAANP